MPLPIEPGRFPRVIELLPHAHSLAWHKLFDTGLELLLAGLESKRPPPRSDVTPKRPRSATGCRFLVYTASIPVDPISDTKNQWITLPARMLGNVAGAGVLEPEPRGPTPHRPGVAPRSHAPAKRLAPTTRHHPRQAVIPAWVGPLLAFMVGRRSTVESVGRACRSRCKSAVSFVRTFSDSAT